MLHADLSGHHAWVNPPFDNIPKIIAHYKQCKIASPQNTSGVFVLPDWRGVTELCKGMRLLKQYPVGTRLFTAPNPTGNGRHLMPGVRWRVNVFYDPPRPAITIASMSSGRPRMAMTGVLAGSPCVVRIDNGAETSAVLSSQFAKQLGITPKPLAEPLTAAGYDGHASTVEGYCHLKLQVGPYKGTLKFLVVPTDGNLQVVLGEHWLTQHAAVLNFADMSCSLRRHAKLLVLRAMHPPVAAQPRPVDAPLLLSAMQVQKAMKRDRLLEVFQVVVRDSGLETAAPAPAPDPDIVPQAKLDELLNRYKVVFPDKLPDGLPPDRDIGHTIPLEPGAKPVFKPLFRYSPWSFKRLSAK